LFRTPNWSLSFRFSDYDLVKISQRVPPGGGGYLEKKKDNIDLELVIPLNRCDYVEHMFIGITHGILCVIFLSSVNGQYYYNNIILNKLEKRVHAALLPESAFF